MALALSLAPTSSSSSSLLSRNPNPSPNLITTHLNSGSQRRIYTINSLRRSFKCLQPSSKDVKASPFSISAIVSSSSSSSHTTELVPHKLQRLVKEFKSLTESIDRLKWVLHYASLLTQMPESARIESNRVMGCTARVWLDADLGQDGKMRFWGDSDSDVSKGMCSCLIKVWRDPSPRDMEPNKPRSHG